MRAYNDFYNTDKLNYKLLSAQTNGLFCLLCILLLICSCMFWCIYHLQGAYTNVKTYSSKTVLQ